MNYLKTFQITFFTDLLSPSIDEYIKYILQLYKIKKDISITNDLFNSLTNIEQKIIHYLRDSNVNMSDDTRPDQQLDGCLTHLELLLLLILLNEWMKNYKIKFVKQMKVMMKKIMEELLWIRNLLLIKFIMNIRNMY